MFESGFPQHWTTLYKLMWLYRLTVGGGGSGTITTVTGTSPLTLVNALAHNIRSLVQFGKCVQNGTPTPDSPVDILCNNGALRYGALGANLFDPCSSAILLNYYRNASTGALTQSNPNFLSAGYIPVKPNTSYVLVGRRKSDNTISAWNRIYWFDADKNFINTCSYTQNTVTVATSPANAAYAQYGINYNNSSTNVVTQAEVDDYNYTFCEGTAEPSEFVPFVGGIYTDGTDEVLTVSGQNLVDLSAVTDGYYYDPNGVYNAAPSARMTDYIHIRAGITYTVATTGVQGSSNVRYNLFDAQREWLSQTVDVASAGVTITKSITPAQDGFLRVSANHTGNSYIDWSVFQVVQGAYTAETMPPYQPYVTPQTVADIPMLLSAGDIEDEIELVGGPLTHRIGIKVFDGTETPTAMSTAGAYRFVGASNAENLQNTMVLCTHYKPESPSKNVANMDDLAVKTNATANNHIYFKDTSCQTVADLQAKFAALYAAGTPVILLVVLVNEITEQTTAHSLHSYNGTTIVDAQTNVDPVELRVEYTASA